MANWKLTGNKKFNELSSTKKISAVVLTVIILVFMIYVFIKLEDIFTTKVIYKSPTMGECEEVYKWGNLVSDECKEFKDKDIISNDLNNIGNFSLVINND